MIGRPHLLDNPVWSALTTDHAAVAEGTGLARRYPAAMSQFGGLAELTTAAFADLRALVRDDEQVALGILAGELEVPADLFRMVEVFPSLQLVQPRPAPSPSIDVELVALGSEHGAEMLGLAQRAQLGPFGPRMVEVGAFIGVRDEDGRLIAMGGERCAMPGHVEVSALCTDPAHRGRRLGAAIVALLTRAMHERGVQPCLHVGPTSVAVRLYEGLGFRWRADVQVVVLEAVS